MKINIGLLLMTLCFLSSPAANAARKNLCDEMIESGRSTQDSIEKCLAKLGESPHYKESAASKEVKAEAARLQEEARLVQSANIKMKKFSEIELEDASFGKSFFAVKRERTSSGKIKDSRITKGDTLCHYLGYEKAVRSVLSPEIGPLKAHKNGLFIDTTIFGNAKAEPELYEDKKGDYTVRKFMEVTCAKTEKKDFLGYDEELKKITEDVITMNRWLNVAKEESSKEVNNDPRRAKKKEEKVPNAFTVPDYLQPGSGVSK